MVDAIAIFLILLWALGYLSAYTTGGLIHLVVAVAAVILITRFLQRQRV